MKRNYIAWYKLKSTIESNESVPQFSEREVWWCSLGANIGHEEDGKNQLFERPIFVLKKYNKDLFLALPLSTAKKSSRFYHPLSVGDVNTIVMLSQARVLSAKRLQRRLGRATSDEQTSIWNAYVELHSVKSKPPIQSGESRAPNGDLYTDNSKRERKSQGAKQ